MRVKVQELILEIKEILKNPFKPFGLEEKLAELLEVMKGMSAEELAMCKSDIEDIKKLMQRNIDIVADSANNLANILSSRNFSRRV